MAQLFITVARQRDRVYLHLSRGFPAGHCNVGLPVEDAKALAALIQGMTAAEVGEARLQVEDGGMGGNFEEDQKSA